YLCPIKKGGLFGWCNGACYPKNFYRYIDCHVPTNAIYPLPTLEMKFAMTVSNPNITEIHGTKVNACGGRFIMGPEAAVCTYCPSIVSEACNAMTKNETIIAVSDEGTGAMIVNVPGGQRWYLAPGSTLRSTQPPNSFIPPGSQIDDFAAY
ncbi:hypothetical protein K469DRAFT_545544, partial [Zopfia rhizophila CBS 207.26]